MSLNKYTNQNAYQNLDTQQKHLGLQYRPLDCQSAIHT